MSFRLPNALLIVLSSVIAGSLLGCDSGNNDGGELSAETSEAVAQTFSDAFTVISLAIADIEVTKTHADPKTVNPQGTCPQGGTYDVNGSGESTQSTFSLDVAVDFQDCNGLNGELSIDGNGSFSSSDFFLDLVLDGSIAGPECSLSFDRFRETVASDLTTGATSVILDGNYRGACSKDQFTCSFDDVSVDASSAGSAAIVEQSCRLN